VQAGKARLLVVSATPLIGAFVKAVKKVVKLRMANRFAGCVGFEVALSHVSHMISAIDQYTVPWLVFRWSTESDLSVPVFTTLEFGIDIDYYTAIVEFQMVYDLSDEITGQ
jgi:hypothetical protein